ncbi:hypothetical protein AB0L67_33045 [Streptomyces flaveolus]|uniref:hypothetical protein n=1 Tax=Streptomyces flaveolus TaxID=67297 RepID=UPI0034157BF5
MADGVAATALWALVEEAEIEALVGGPSDMQRFAVGGATVVLGPSGSVIITAAGDALGDSGVWSAEEVRLVGEAPAPVTKRLLGDLEAWGADESSLPIHLAVRVAEGLLYLGTGRRRRAHIMQPPDGREPALTSCGLRLDTRLSRPILDRVRPAAPAPNLPDLGWLDHVNGDRAAALEQFVTGWYPAADQPQPRHPSSAPAGSRSLPGRLQQLYLLAEQRPVCSDTTTTSCPGTKSPPPSSESCWSSAQRTREASTGACPGPWTSRKTTRPSGSASSTRRR